MASLQDMTNTAISYSYYQAMLKCIDGGNMHKNISTTNNKHQNPSEWYTTGGIFDGNTNVSVGYLNDTSDAKQTCREVYSAALNYWQISDTGAFLRAMGYTLNNSGTEYNFSGDTNAQKTGFTAALKRQIGSNNNGYERTDSNTYQLSLAAYKHGCGANSVGELSKQSTEVQKKAESKNEGYDIVRTLNDDGSINTNIVWKADKGNGHNVSDYWPGGLGASQSCTQLAKAIGDSASKLASTVRIDKVKADGAAFLTALGPVRDEQCRAAPEFYDQCVSAFNTKFNSCFNGHTNDNNFTYPNYDVNILANCLGGSAQQIAKYRDVLSGTATTIAETVPDDGTGAGSGAGDPNADPCSGLGGAGSNSVKWIMCPSAQGGNEFAATLDGWIADLLRYDTANLDKIQGTWAAFRNIALGLLVIVALIMIVSQAAGAQVLDAYTIRKAMPRLVFAVLFITLSWPVLVFTVGLFNDLGGMTQNLILAPIGANADNITGASILSGLLTGGGLTAVGVTAGVVGGVTLGWAGIISLILVGALSVLILFFMLAVRWILITACIIFAPIAIIAFVLPNTEKLWKLWLTGLVGALATFPLVMAVIALGKAGALIVLQAL